MDVLLGVVGLSVVLKIILPKSLDFAPKLTLSVGLLYLVFQTLLEEGRLAELQAVTVTPGWIALAFVSRGLGISCTIFRWKVLLEALGIAIPVRRLAATFLIGGFVGKLAPGTLGPDGYRIFDIARQTGLSARPILVTVVERVTGCFTLGILLVVVSPFSSVSRSTGNASDSSIGMLGAGMAGLGLVAICMVLEPRWMRLVESALWRLDAARAAIIAVREAATAFSERRGAVLAAAGLSFGVHCFTIAIYVCTAKALGAATSSVDLVVVSAIMIGATVLPISYAGIGVREAIFSYYLGPLSIGYAIGGFLVAELTSLVGAPVWLARRSKQEAKVDVG